MQVSVYTQTFKNAFPSSHFYLIKQTIEQGLRDVTEWIGCQDIGRNVILGFFIERQNGILKN